MIFVTIDGIANLTESFNFTTKTVEWLAEVVQVWRNDVNDPTFTYNLSTKTLSIPGATGGNTIKVKFRLYLIANSVGVYAPKDPTNPGSDGRYWEARLTSSPIVTRSIEDLSRGYGITDTSALKILTGSGWEQLLTANTTFEYQTVNIYKNGTLNLKCLSVSQQFSYGAISLNLQKPNVILDQLATFGDPNYLVTVDPTHNSAYYNGANIPDKYYGQAIPMIFGTSTPYTRTTQGSADSGTVIGTPLNPPLVGPIAFSGVESIIRPIPISSTELLVGKIPSYQSLTGNLQSYTPTTTVRLLTKLQGYTVIPNAFIGQAVNLSSTSGTLAVDLGAIISPTDAYTTIERTSGTFVYDTISIDLNIRVININPTKKIGAFPTVSVSQTTPAGHRLIKLTFPIGTDLRIDTPVIVLDNLTGARSGPKVLQYILESHGIAVDSANFITVDTKVPQIINLISGIGTSVPKVSDLVTEINQSVFASIYPDTTTDTQKYIYYGAQTATVTLTEDNIKDLKVSMDSRDILGKIKFSSAYITQEDLQDSVNTIEENSNAVTVIGTPKQDSRTHVFESTPTRLTDIMTHYGNSQKKIEFVLLDDTIDCDIGTNFIIDHYGFKGEVFITSVQILDLGRFVTSQVFLI